MRTRIKAKLKSASGESLAETLLALLISALALAMLAGAISTALNLVTKSNEQMATYYGGDNLVATQSGTPTTVGNTATVFDASGTEQQKFFVKCYNNGAFPGTTVVSYVSYTPGD